MHISFTITSSIFAQNGANGFETNADFSYKISGDYWTYQNIFASSLLNCISKAIVPYLYLCGFHEFIPKQLFNFSDFCHLGGWMDG